MKKNLVLLGMMAVGKSTLGKIVAKKQDLEFVDTDKNIENKCSMKISEIFNKKGEKFFRAQEEIEALDAADAEAPEAPEAAEGEDQAEGSEEAETDAADSEEKE